jgi:subtilisin family serine protease
MRRRHGLAAFVAAALLITQVAGVAARAGASTAGSGAAAAAPIEGKLQRDLAAGRAQRMIVEFKDKANLKPAAAVKDRSKRGQAVIDALRSTAGASQRTATATAARLRGVDAKTYWLTNVMVVEGAPATLSKLATTLAKDPAVARIRAERSYPLVQPIDPKVAVLAAAGEPEWGVAKIGADKAWDAGVLGQGVVVATIDTGVDFTHPALVDHYLGNNGDGTFTHDYHWWDPSGTCPDPEPCDNVAHGTHTMGTILGGDGPGPFTPDIGVAPGAKWIAAKGCEVFDCSESSLLSSGQWVMAPTDLNGENPDPSQMPDIVSNSWGGGPGDPFYLETVRAWRAAGIIPVFASGNPGPFCGEGGSPGDFLEAFSVGATDSDDIIADFSGRGPSAYGKVNPDVSAPGVDVVSSVPGGGYEAFSGTSMATPHVAGTMALLLSADSSLRGNFKGVTDPIRATAVDRLDDSCGGDPDGDPNNVYGDGRIDAAAAVNLVATGGTLSGTITDSVTGDPIAGAQVTADDGTRPFSTSTGADGKYEMLLAAGDYIVSASSFGYFGAVVPSVTVITDEITDQPFALDALPRFKVSGTVKSAENGAPIADVTVRAVGTPVDPVTTDAAGKYSLTLPIGTFTLSASADGCTETGSAEITSAADDVTQDFALFRKLDDFGHACAPTAFDWVDAQDQTALIGDEIAGRLRLPFAFDFYGESYQQVYVAENGYVNFLAPDAGFFIPTAIPASGTPNAAIYPFWMDLYITDVGAIDSDTVGTAPNRAFVIEYSDVRVLGTATLLDFEIKLWENGTIDLLYGSNAANPGDGRTATVGIENATGTDALQIGFFESNLSSNSAIRITTVPTGFIGGTVTDANDGLGIAGAEVVAKPGGRKATTGDDGSYTLRVLAGSYNVTASANLYEDGTAAASVTDGNTTTHDFSLRAPTAAVDVTEIVANVDFGSTSSHPVTLSNGGSLPLDWVARERDQGVTLPPLPEPKIAVTRNPVWHRQALPKAFPRWAPTDIQSASLTTIINDPIGDATGPIDVGTVRAGSDGTTVVSMALDFSPSTPIGQAVGYVFLDTDEDPSTGVPATDLAGLPTQDIGAEYFLDLFLTHDSDPVVLIVDTSTFEVVAAVPVSFAGQSMLFDLPIEALGNDDGNIATAMVLGDFNAPYDWAPDIGHGTIQPFSEVDWMTPDPATGETAVGGNQVINVTLGSPGLSPGEYHAQLVLVTNAPRSEQVSIDVTLNVALPDSFGGVSGTVSDGHSGDPIADATVTVHGQWPPGTPLDIVATTDDAGAWSIIGPAGTWPTDITKDGYVPVAQDVEIASGISTPGADAVLHKIQPHATLEGDTEPVFLLKTGGKASTTLVLGNTGGHADLHFTVGEVDLGGSSAGLAGNPAKRTLPAGLDSKARSTRGFGAAAAGTAVPPRLAADGDVIASWPSGMSLPWGVAFTNDVWLSDPFDLIDVQFTRDGERLSDFALQGFGDWGADMAFDRARDLIWQVNVGGDNGIYGIDPADGSVQQMITGSPWGDIDQRGLAYDPAADVFYIGGWNEGVVYRVAGPSHPTPGETLSQCNPPDPNISGLAWNARFGMLWEATNSETDTIWLIDPFTCEATRGIPHPDGGHFGGAGLEVDAFGGLWTVGQNSGNAYLIESGLPAFVDVPWLSVGPTEGTLAPDGSVDLDIDVDATGLSTGVYKAVLGVLTDDPDHRILQVPVTLVVTDYQQGVNSGGGRFVDGDGDVYAADRSFGSGPYGYVHRGSTRSTGHSIANTTDDGRYKNLREDMTAYKFNVANGLYQVELSFAELQFRHVADRIFDVSLEGTRVLRSLDIVDEAGARYTALDKTFVVEVTDGTLDIEFAAPRGHKPIVNAILVTHLPEGSPGT